jgi:hypothetical protein
MTVYDSDQKQININNFNKFEVCIYNTELPKNDSFFFIRIVLTILVISYKPVLIAEAESFTPIPTTARSFSL